MLGFSRLKIIFVSLVCLMTVYFSLPSMFYWEQNNPNIPQWMPDSKINLGLDLLGGAHLLLQVDFDNYRKTQLDSNIDEIRSVLYKKKINYSNLSSVKNNAIEFRLLSDINDKNIKNIFKDFSDLFHIIVQNNYVKFEFKDKYVNKFENQIMDQSIEIVRKRVDQVGTKEPIIQRQGNNQILVQLPGIADPSELERLLGKIGKLTFHFLANSDHNIGIKKLPMVKDGNKKHYVAINNKVIISGEKLIDAQVSFSEKNKGQPIVVIKFDRVGAKKFADVTTNNVGKNLAIVLDNQIISAPVISEPIQNGSAIISGNFTIEEANQLAILLRSGSLPAPLKIIEERTVGPSLGSDSIESGKWALILGLILVMVFMYVTYGIFGIYANIALIVNLLMIIAVMGIFKSALTFPGIAGMVLTLGMAVDANVLIFERIREELRGGNAILNSINQGFDRAYVTILDSNITTLIAASILYFLGSGPVQNFAVTLSIGIISSMFSAIMLTRVITIMWLKYCKPKPYYIKKII